MTKKDYIAAAKLIGSEFWPYDISMIEEAFIQFFDRDNPRFDADRFHDAVMKAIEEEA